MLRILLLYTKTARIIYSFQTKKEKKFVAQYYFENVCLACPKKGEQNLLAIASFIIFYATFLSYSYTYTKITI